MGKIFGIIKNCQELPGYVAWLAPDGTVDIVDLCTSGRYTVPRALECVTQALSRPVYRVPHGIVRTELLQVAADMVIMHIWAQHTTCNLWDDVIAEMLCRDAEGGRIG
jgi:hypothetical protein